MALRLCGFGKDALRIYVHEDGLTPDGRFRYRGTIVTPSGARWAFDDLCSGRGGWPGGTYYSNSPEAYDRAAASALSFASYYTSHNRSDDVPEWAPSPEVADEIDEIAASTFAPEGFKPPKGCFTEGEGPVVFRSRRAGKCCLDAFDAAVS